MIKKVAIIIPLVMLSHVNAETCPDINAIKYNQLNRWQPLDIDNAEPVTGQNWKTFQEKVHSFAIAAWRPDAPEGPAECFYYAIQPDIDYLGVFLVKQTGKPDMDLGNWHPAGFDVMQCDVSIRDCRFTE